MRGNELETMNASIASDLISIMKKPINRRLFSISNYFVYLNNKLIDVLDEDELTIILAKEVLKKGKRASDISFKVKGNKYKIKI